MMKTEITIEGKNLNDIFRLPYVTGIVKLTNGDFVVTTDKHTMHRGDKIIDYGNGKYDVVKLWKQ